ncbi:MAG: WecB/TagA/CpsF family glycosyltransferase [Candidatus Pacebacteria bacterium]|nr:WecB/TagA/CpsF family glycosyltransferase [Candidatus Paceibacterota bacterium]
MIKILGVKLDTLKKGEVLEKVNLYLKQRSSIFITTPNPEIILAAQKDEEFFYILNQADLSLPDGFGLKLAGCLLGKSLNRQTGSDLTLKLLSLAKENDKKVLFVLWSKGLSSAKDLTIAIEEKFPGLNFLTISTDRQASNLDWDKIKQFSPEIMLVALGAPFQEKFIYLNKYKLPSLNIATGIGGALDFVAEKIKRAPKLMQKLGLEWLFRLYKQPRRWSRIFKAVFVFSYKIFCWKFIWPFLYRKNVACLLYKKEQGQYYFLIVERKDEPGHFQLVQGGLDGETIKQAGFRELEEELNLKSSNLEFKEIFKNVYKYSNHSWPKNFFKRIIKACGYRGQKQSLAVVEFIGEEKDIKVNYWDHRGYLWAKEEELLNKVHDFRKPAVEKFLEKFKDFKNQNNANAFK